MSTTFYLISKSSNPEIDDELIDDETFEWTTYVGGPSPRFAPHLEPVLGFGAHIEGGNVGNVALSESQIDDIQTRIRFSMRDTTDQQCSERLLRLSGILHIMQMRLRKGEDVELCWS